MMSEADTSVTEAETPMTETEHKICMINDAQELEELSAAPAVTCGMCGVKAHDAANVCEPGIHSDPM